MECPLSWVIDIHLTCTLICLEGQGGAPGSPPGSSARHLGDSGVAFDGLAHLDRAGGTRRNQCFVIAPRRGESIKRTIWAKIPSCPPNGHELKPLPFPTIPVLPLTCPPFSLGRCRFSSGGPIAAQTHLHYSIYIVKICLSFP